MTPHFPIYLDYGATTPVDPRVVDAMIPWLREHFGNPASRSHAWGWEAEEAVEKARAQVADLIGADSREIVWTSGATESINLALKGAAQQPGLDGSGRHVVGQRGQLRVEQFGRHGLDARHAHRVLRRDRRDHRAQVHTEGLGRALVGTQARAAARMWRF